MTIIEKITASSDKLSLIGYSETDIIKNMCPFELGIGELICNNENENLGFEGCQRCWYQEYKDK
jgi:hypothetical protein